jgi:hypothetical protein
MTKPEISDEAVEAARNAIPEEAYVDNLSRAHIRLMLEAAANKIGSKPDAAPTKRVRVWTGTEWVQVVNHGWDTSLIPSHNPGERIYIGDLRAF